MAGWTFLIGKGESCFMKGSSIALTVLFLFFSLSSIVFSAYGTEDSSDTTGNCSIAVNALSISGSKITGSPVTFTVDAENSCSDTKQYRFSYHPDYGTDGYTGLNWESMTSSEYQTSNSCTFTFDTPGRYIVVVWVKNDTSDANDGVAIIGGSVDIRSSHSDDDSCHINFEGFNISGTREVGSSVTFTMAAENPCSTNTSFRYSVHPYYGTDGYDSLRWESMTTGEYTTESSIDYTFEKSGKYVVVVWAKNATTDSNTGVPIIGTSIEIKDENSEYLESVVTKDSGDNIYQLTGQSDSVADFSVFSDNTKDPADILTSSETGITDGFTKLDFSDTADPGLRTEITIVYDRIPSMIIAYDEDDGEYYTLPFSVTGTNSVSLHLDSKDISILPVYDTEQETTIESSAYRQATNTTSYTKRFEIVVNDGESLKIKTEMNLDFIDYSCLSINGSDCHQYDVLSDGTIFNEDVGQTGGIYNFKLYYAEGRTNPLRTWIQDVFVQVSADLFEIPVASIAGKYAPILAYNDDEEYYPVNLDYLFGDSSAAIEFDIPPDSSGLGRLSEGIGIPHSQVASFMPYNGHGEGLINYGNLSSSASKNYQIGRKGSANDSTVYYSMLKGDGNYYYLNYHMFYTFDPKTGTSSDPATGNHVFDRESMTLVFFGKPDIDSTPEGVLFSGHLSDQTLYFKQNDDENFYEWSGGRIFIPWASVYKYQDSPIASIARGSHAIYPLPGTYKCLTLTEPAGGSDNFASDADWNRILVPPTLDSALDIYTLSDLNLGNIESTGENACLAFSGYWVDCLGSWTNAKFPPFTERETDPDCWYSHSDYWGIDRDTLPQYSQDLMDDLDQYLESELETAIESECGAYIAPGVWKYFDCYNLAAIGKTTGDDPLTPSWSLIGGYWQWGRKGPDESQWYDTNTANFAHGPTGPDEDDLNDEEINGWDDSHASNGAWSDFEKTDNDPCPTGYRVPTLDEWRGVVENNTKSAVGTSWSPSATNYSTGAFFGDSLMLPAAGHRNYSSGLLEFCGEFGIYWATTAGAVESIDYGGFLSFWENETNTGFGTIDSRYGAPVRCIAE